MKGWFGPIQNPGWLAFQLGLFLLPSSALLAGLSLFIACVAGSRNRAVSLWCDAWMRPLIIAGALMLIGAFTAETGPLAWAGLGWHG